MEGKEKKKKAKRMRELESFCVRVRVKAGNLCSVVSGASCTHGRHIKVAATDCECFTIALNSSLAGGAL